MKIRILTVLALMLGTLTPVAAYAAPGRVANFSLRDGSQSAKLATLPTLSGPCAPGAIYELACDVDRDGDVDIFDIQLTAGRWDQTGTWMSDNDHNHLGQTWTGSNNPLKIDGSFSSPDPAALVLSNSDPLGDGLSVTSAGQDGMQIGFTGSYGVYVFSAGDDGLRVQSAGSDGVHIEYAEAAGVRVYDAGTDGVLICSTGIEFGCNEYGTLSNGVEIVKAENYGVMVHSAGDDGIWVESADGVGVWANTTQASGQWGFYTPDKIRGSNVTLESLSLVAQVSDPDSLAAGDLVTAAGVADPLSGSTVHVPLVRLADGAATAVVGVVEGRLVLVEHGVSAQPGEGEAQGEPSPPELRSADGPAQPGDYVALTIYGAAQVKVENGEALVPGQRVTVGANGAARALRTFTVQLAGGEGTADITESAPTLGVVLEPPEDGMVWVLVNPQ